MGTTPQHTNRQASKAQITRQDRLQIALALHSPVERDVQAAQYQEKSEEELLQMANALLPAIENRTIFLEGEILGKEGFAQAVQEHYATIYRGMAAVHQLLEEITNEPNQEDEVSRFEDEFLSQLRGDYYAESLAARKGWLSLLLNIAENLTHAPSASGLDLFDALEEAILDYRRRYPRMAAAMQHYLQSWLRANAEN
jgi:hypothetical protein